MPPGPQYRLALARIASFIGALQQVRRVDPVRVVDDVAGRDPLAAMTTATR